MGMGSQYTKLHLRHLDRNPVQIFADFSHRYCQEFDYTAMHRARIVHRYRRYIFRQMGFQSIRIPQPSLLECMVLHDQRVSRVLRYPNSD